jgi:hypothetical protein
LIGFPSTGKSTLFQLMTSAKDAPRGKGDTVIGISKVPDMRLEKLTAIFNPKKTVPATIEFTDLIAPGRSGAAALVDVAGYKNADALVHVVRAFRDPAVPHPTGSVNPARDAQAMEDELILADLGVAEREPRPRVLPDQAMEGEPAGIAGERLEEQPSPRQRLELARGVGDACRLEQWAAEALEVHCAGERGAYVCGRRRDDLLREVREQGALGSLQAVEHPFAAAFGGCAQGFDGEPDGGGPAVGRARDARRRVPAGGRRDDVGGEERGDQALDLADAEREGGTSDVAHLALGTQPLDAERRVVA